MARTGIKASGPPDLSTTVTVTDVGDSAWIVGDSGRIVPTQDPEALAHAWHDLLNLGGEKRRLLGEAARNRIEENFSLSLVVAMHEELYKQAASRAFNPAISSTTSGR